MLSPVFQWRGLYSLHSHLLASSTAAAPPPTLPPGLLMPEDMLPTTTTSGNNSRKRKLTDEESSSSSNSLPFSRLMRLMAAKYQEKEEAAEKAAAEALAANAAAAAALFSPLLPYLPVAPPPPEKRLRTEEAAANVPLDLSRGSTPELDVAGGGDDSDSDNDQKPCVAGGGERDGAVLRAEPDAKSYHSWSVERVAEFVGSVEECREYAQLFRDEKIDGSCLGALSLYHLTAVLRIKIGPALKILKAVQALR